jgi:hypothetical protein
MMMGLKLPFYKGKRKGAVFYTVFEDSLIGANISTFFIVALIYSYS